jgi:hypothetical protein
MRARVEIWDQVQEFRKLGPRAKAVAERCLGSQDERIALAAAQFVVERGWGRPQLAAEVNVNHAFVVAPQVMEQSAWLERRGQPIGAAGDAWLAQQQKTAQPERRTSEAPTSTAAASKDEPPTIDAVAEEMLLNPDPTAPRPPGSKLN